MPGQTPDLSLPYMVDGDPLADVATIMQTLAERLEGGGWTSFTPDPATGYAMSNAEYWVWGPLLCLRMQVVNNTGAAITMGATGNITDILIGDAGCVPLILRPSGAGNEAPGYICRATTSGAATFFARLNVDGSVALTHGQPGASWANAGTIYINEVFPMTTPPVLP